MRGPAEFLAGIRRALRRFLELAAGALSRLARLVHQSDLERATARMWREQAQWYADRGDQTLRLDYDLGPGALVFDAGGYHGDWAADVFCRFGCRIEVFEPVASFAEVIAARFARNPSVDVHRYGLAGEDRRDRILLHEGGSSAVMEPIGAAGEREEIELRDVVAVMDRLDRDQVDLIKINVEGGEYELLERLLEAETVDRFRYLQIQFHRGAPAAESRMREIQNGLSRTHRRMWSYPWIWESWERKT
jgi:FkbM family methyltransferase